VYSNVDLDHGEETKDEVEMADVYSEISDLCSKYRITKFASKEVTRKYAFELHDVPAESNYLKVLYDYERKISISFQKKGIQS
jgi:DNA polymerase alpha subunit A